MLSPSPAKNVGKFECVVGKLKIGEIVGNIHLERKMIFQVLLIFPLYVGIFALFFRFRFLIKTMTELNEIFSDMFFEGSAEEVSKRDFLVEKLKTGNPFLIRKLRGR